MLKIVLFNICMFTYLVQMLPVTFKLKKKSIYLTNVSIGFFITKHKIEVNRLPRKIILKHFNFPHNEKNLSKIHVSYSSQYIKSNLV